MSEDGTFGLSLNIEKETVLRRAVEDPHPRDEADLAYLRRDGRARWLEQGE